jgi:hypothetical protein
MSRRPSVIGLKPLFKWLKVYASSLDRLPSVFVTGSTRTALTESELFLRHLREAIMGRAGTESCSQNRTVVSFFGAVDELPGTNANPGRSSGYGLVGN